MIFFRSCCQRQCCCLTLLLLFASLSGIFAQGLSIAISPPSGPIGDYTIGVNGLHTDDLVFYRFSDAVDYTAVNSFNNPKASVTRKFPVANTTVSAYVARKSGPIELVTAEIPNPECGCSLPTSLAPGVHIKPSWSPSTQTFQALVDDLTTPDCNLPTDPWFFLSVTVIAPIPGYYADIDLPAHFTIGGAIVKNLSIGISGQGTYTVNDTEINSIDYPTQNKVKIRLSPNVGPNTKVTVFLIVKCDTELGEQSTFTARFFDGISKTQGSTSTFRTTTQTDPHDPNTLTPLQDGTCVHSQSTNPLTYRVNFQNLGEGVAKTVKVKITFNTQIINLAAPFGIASNPLYTSTIVGSNFIEVTFENINLPGTGGVPPSLLELTKGWLELTVRPNPCLNQEPGGIFITNAKVTFLGFGLFKQELDTDPATQLLTNKCAIDPYCNRIPDFAPNSNERSSETIEHATFTPVCYPTLINDILHIDAPASMENSSFSVTMSDLSGKIWGNKTIQTIAGAETKEILETTALPTGMYLIQIRSGKNTSVFKVIKM